MFRWFTAGLLILGALVYSGCVLPGQVLSGGTPDWSNLNTYTEQHYMMSANPWWVKQGKIFSAGHFDGNDAIAYQNAANCRYGGQLANDNSGVFMQASGVGCEQADQAKINGDDWYLYRPDGTLQRSTFGQPVMDVGDPDYQRAWVNNVLARIKGRWDGVFLDDMNQRCNCAGGLPTQYPTNTAWRNAMDSFVAYTSQQLRAASVETVLPNIGNWLSDVSHGCTWAQQYGGAFEEHFAQFASFAQARQQIECTTVDQGQFFGSTTDTTKTRYAAGVALLFAGQVFVGTAANDDHNHFQWNSIYDDMQELGQPTAVATQQPDGNWRRNYENGYVIVNPTAKTTSVITTV